MKSPTLSIVPYLDIQGLRYLPFNKATKVFAFWLCYLGSKWLLRRIVGIVREGWKNSHFVVSFVFFSYRITDIFTFRKWWESKAPEVQGRFTSSLKSGCVRVSSGFYSDLFQYRRVVAPWYLSSPFQRPDWRPHSRNIVDLRPLPNGDHYGHCFGWIWVSSRRSDSTRASGHWDAVNLSHLFQRGDDSFVQISVRSVLWSRRVGREGRGLFDRAFKLLHV